MLTWPTRVPGGEIIECIKEHASCLRMILGQCEVTCMSSSGMESRELETGFELRVKMDLMWVKLLCSDRASSGDGRHAIGGVALDDYGRSQFDKDYGRAVFCAPVRRLQDKTQVFPLDPCDSVRTRLTHSLEVSSVARGLARAVASSEVRRGAIDETQARAIETIVSTSALLHDIGNPAFGHSGEAAIQDWFKLEKNTDVLKGLSDEQQADFLRFEGNAQTLRLVTRLQVLARPEALNLTYGTLSALQKYVSSASGADRSVHSLKKPGFFLSESGLVAEWREHTGLSGSARNPMALLMEAADDIAFSVIDIEDAIKKRFVSWDVFEQWMRAHAKKHDRAAELIKFLERTRSYVGELAPDLAGSLLDQARSQIFRTHLIEYGVQSTADAFAQNRDRIMAGEFHTELIEASEAWESIKACKGFPRKLVYNHPEILTLESRGRIVVRDLMDFFWEGAREAGRNDEERKGHTAFGEKALSLISGNYQRVFRSSEDGVLPLKYHQIQMVTDQVCGMTDGYACRLHKELFGG